MGAAAHALQEVEMIAPSKANKTAENAKTVETGGEIFENSGIELVRGSGNETQLLYWEDGRDPIIAPQVLRNGTLYTPVKVHTTLWSATVLPSGIVRRGSSAQLFEELESLFPDYLGWPADPAFAAAAWLGADWFSDVLFSPISFLVYGPDISAAIQLFRLLRCITWRPLMVGGLRREALNSLMRLKPYPTLDRAEHVARPSYSAYQCQLSPAGGAWTKRQCFQRGLPQGCAYGSRRILERARNCCSSADSSGSATSAR
jgi:hypothetical protein